ncbi:MAG: SpoIIE family protein phosphatase [Crocinitomicaceae bacterium]|nr:SpoIIE family protein phosphatase [Crocinitomicaceae bacterium]
MIFLLFVATNTVAQKGSYVEFKRFDANDLGVSEISFQCWDKNGTCWARTEQGLLSFNGYYSKIHKHIPGNSNSVITDTIMRVFQTDTNELWISYVSEPYITRFDPIENSYEHFELPLLNEDGEFEYSIVKIVKDHLGQFWVLTWGNGILLLDAQTSKVERFVFPSSEDSTIVGSFVKELTQIEGNEYLLCFFQGERTCTHKPLKFNVETKTFERIDFSEYLKSLENEMRIRMDRFLTIINFAFVDKDKNYWLGSYSGMLFVDNKNKTISRVSQEGVEKTEFNMGNCRVFSELGDELWIGTTNMGVLRLRKSQRKIDLIQSDPYNPTTLYDNRIVTMSKDPMGNMWICSEEGMLSIYVPLTDRFNVHLWSTMRLNYSNRSEQVIPVNQITVNEDGTVWISSATGLQLYSPKLKKVISHVVMDPAGKYDLKSDNVGNFKIVDNFIYANVDRSSIRYEIKTGYTKKYKDNLDNSSILFRHSNPEKFLYTFTGILARGSAIYKVDPETGEVKLEHDLGKGIVLSETFTIELPSGKWLIHEGIARDKYGRFVVYDPIAKTHELYSPSSKEFYFPDSSVYIAYNDGSDIWIGSETGLYKFDENTKKSTNWNKKIGNSAGEGVKGMVKDKQGRMWIAFTNELLLWDQKTGETERFGVDAGLNVGSFLPAIGQKDKFDNIYFATINGILVFKPSSIEYSDFEFRLFWDDITVNSDTLSSEVNKEVLDGDYQFHWDDNYITFSFHTSHVFGSGQHNVFYRLKYGSKEADIDWIDNAKSNTIKLSNLPHGDYALEVKAISNMGVESNVYSIPFTIKRPYWLAWWFYAIIIIVVGAVVITYVKYREKALRKRSEELERTVEVRTAEVVEQKREAERQKEIVIEKQQEITDSINYAKKIQEAIMPSLELFTTNLPESFILYKPKDIVAGDFYWMEEVNDGVIFAAADCTGHGVPGAMVSVVCNNALNRSVREFGYNDPAKILDKTRELVIEQFEKGSKKNGEEPSIKDGMDISLCFFNKKENKIYWAGANNPLWLMRNGELVELKGDKQPIGKYHDPVPFTSHSKAIESGDLICIFSDGYADQFGGDKGKKFKTKAFKELLSKVADQPMEEIKTFIDNSFEEWKGEYEQVDDVCVIGVRF